MSSPLEEGLAAALVALLAREDVRSAIRTAIAPTTDEWLGEDRLPAGLAMRTLVDARRRGELELGRAGRRPIVRRSELERWMRARGRGAKSSANCAPASSVYELAVAAARRSAPARSA